LLTRPVNASLIILVLLGLERMASARDQELTTAQALDRLEGAVQSVKSFDVKVDATMRWLIVTNTSVNKSERGREEVVVTSRRKIAPGESPQIHRARFRQVMQKGKGRIEFLGDTFGSDSSSLVYDREMQKHSRPKERSLMIQDLSLAPIRDGMDYRTAYLTWIGPRLLVDCLRGRKNVRLLHDNSELVLEGPPDPAADNFPTWGLKVTIDPGHGFMPSVVETLIPVQGKPMLAYRREVKRWKRVASGWVPTKVITTHYNPDPKNQETFGAVNDEVIMEVDEEQSNWNKEIPDNTFTLAIPAGTQVIDGRKGVMYTTGKPDPGKNLDDLASGAKNMIPLTPLQPAPRRWMAGWMALAGAGALVVLTAIVLFVRRLRRRKPGV